MSVRIVQRLSISLSVIGLAAAHAQAQVLLSLNKPVTGSGYYSDGSEVFPLSNIDNGQYGDTGYPYHWSFWLTPNGTTSGYATIDLQSVDTITQLKLQDTHNRGYYDRGSDAFTVSLSSDGVNFTTIVNDSFTVSEWQNLTLLTYDIVPTAAQYVKYSFTSIYGGASGGLGELDVYGTQGSAVPEPGTYALLGSLGLTGAAFLRRRRAR